MDGSPPDDWPRILLCNDDGIHAPGLQSLATALDGMGELFVVAPTTEQSAVGHAITVRDPVRAREVEFEVPSGSIPAWGVTGTPADSVKLACHELLDSPPDLVVSGINQGPNTAVNVLYSGTVSAATEASILGLDALAVSLCDWSTPEFEVAGRWAHRLVQWTLDHGLPPGILLNVNVPGLPADEIQGVALTRQARSRWEEGFEERTDPADRPYYWLAGTFVNLDDGRETDLSAIDRGYVSVTPIQHDMTAYDAFASLRDADWDESVDEGETGWYS
ncbi:MAG: 5'/3'-nucleotidase SurE [Salinibacter sp.]